MQTESDFAKCRLNVICVGRGNFGMKFTSDHLIWPVAHT